MIISRYTGYTYSLLDKKTWNCCAIRRMDKRYGNARIGSQIRSYHFSQCIVFEGKRHTHFLRGQCVTLGFLKRFVHTITNTTLRDVFSALQRHYRLLREELNKLPTPKGLEDLAEPLASPGSPIELSGTPGTPGTPGTTTPNTPSTVVASATTPIHTNNTVPSSTSSQVHHDIDTDVEMEKMVSKMCE